MVKIKKKKELKSSNLIIIFILCFLIVVSCVYAGKAYAYFSSTATASGSTTMGHLHINGLENHSDEFVFQDLPLKVVPNQNIINEEYHAVVDSNIPYYTRVHFKVTITPEVGATHVGGNTCSDAVISDNDILRITIGNSGWRKALEQDEDGYDLYYKLAPTPAPETSDYKENFNVLVYVQSWVGNNACTYYMNASITIAIKVEIIQADYLESDSIGGTFGSVSEMHARWEQAENIVPQTNSVRFFDNDMGVDNEILTVNTLNALPMVSSSSIQESGTTKYFQGYTKNGDTSTLYYPNQVVMMNAGDTYVPVYSQDQTFDPYGISWTYDSGTDGYKLKILNQGMSSSGPTPITRSMTIPAMHLGKPVTILESIHENGQLENIVLPETLKVLQPMAFYDEHLTSITIPSSMTNIDISEHAVLSNNPLESINVSENNLVYSSLDGILYNKDKTTLLLCPSQKISVAIPNSVTKIEDYAFHNCMSLSNISIPSSVVDIGAYAFNWCYALEGKTIALSSNIEHIGFCAFAIISTAASNDITLTYAGTVSQMTNIHDHYEVDNPKIMYAITCTDGEFAIHYNGGAPCLWIETEVWCYDKKRRLRYKKKIKDLTYDDDIIVWDFDEGKFTTAKALFITKISKSKIYTITTFSDGSIIKSVGADKTMMHRLFNYDTQKFEYFGCNLKIGTKTFNADGKLVEVVKVEYVEKPIEYMNVITEKHFNLFANNILTSNRLNNLYPIKDMKYVKDNRILHDRNEFPEIEDEYFYGLRLAEQPVQTEQNISDKYVGTIVEYVDNLKKISKPRS